MVKKRKVDQKNVQDAWDLYQIAVLASSKNKSQSVESGRWNNYVKPSLGEKLIKELTKLDYLMLRRKLESQGLSPQTVYHCLSLLRRVLNKYSEWENSISSIPNFKDVMPKFDNKRLRYLTDTEIKVILDMLGYLDESGDWRDIALFAVNTGLRRSELFNLHLQNVNFIDRYIAVVDTKSCRNRTVPLNDIAYDLLLKKRYC